MTINKFEPYHGIAIYQLIEELSKNDLSLRIKHGITKNAYLLTSNDITDVSQKIGIYIKYTEKKRSPWRYSIREDEQLEIDILSKECNETFILLINGLKDGIACMPYQNLKEILDDNFELVEWISVKRRLNKEYTIKGKDGKLSRKIPRSLFPKIIIDKILEIRKDN